MCYKSITSCSLGDIKIFACNILNNGYHVSNAHWAIIGATIQYLIDFYGVWLHGLIVLVMEEVNFITKHECIKCRFMLLTASM